MAETAPHYTVIVIGTGFGGSMAALTLARAMDRRAKQQQKKGESILMLERGTWWTTPVGTVQDKEVRTFDFLKHKKQPVQFWSSVEHFKGFIDIVLRCLRRKGNEDGLYDLTMFRKRGLLGLFGGENDGVSIMRAAGVGGGSLIYANVTIQPPDLIFESPAWPRSWDSATRNKYYDIARNAIGYGVVWAWDHWVEIHENGQTADPGLKVNSGLSSVSTRTARLDPHWIVRVNPETGRTIRYIDPSRSTPAVHTNDLWIDRARVFQTEMKKLTNDYGTVDSSINDLTPEGTALEPNYPTDKPKNYCERQGRCILGCLPGARHTLNKQLMRAIVGKVNPANPDGDPPDYNFMKLESLAEVDVIEARPQGGYVVHYFQRDREDPSRSTPRKVTADKVIVAAGCVGTNEILLRSKDRRALPHLSDKVGFGFSTNGDFLGFLEKTKERVSLTRGPVTTSFAHLHTPQAPLDPQTAPNPGKFHTVEDNGIPRPFSSLLGFGIPMIRNLTKGWGRWPRIFVLFAIGHWIIHRLWKNLLAFFLDSQRRQEFFQSEDELTANVMCVAAMGRAESKGQFRLGRGSRETPLRVSQESGPFYKDPIYKEIRGTLDKFAQNLTGRENSQFLNPFLSRTFDALDAKSVTLTHPLGGCRIAENASEGVVDEYGRAYDKTKSGGRPFYEGLYVADASIIPTSLGVNPSLTISALTLRIAEKIVEELDGPRLAP